MARLDPAAAAEKWQRRLSAAGPDIAAGIDRVSEAPGTAAVRKRDKWRAGVQGAEDKWARNTARVGLEEWRAKAKALGVRRVAEGAAANVDKVAAFNVEFYPFLDRVRDRIRAMPDTSPADRINRMVAQVTETAKFRRGGGPGGGG